MITAWRIENFKSYRGEHHIPFSLINVIAGANSSGKSTLIQSILALKQTLQFGANDKSLLLNGPLLRLGSFKDVVTSGVTDSLISIGFDCSFSLEAVESLQKEVERGSYIFWNRSKSDDFLSTISINSTWMPSKPTDDLTQHQAVLTPSMRSTHFGISRSSSTVQYATINRSRKIGRAAPYDIILDAASLEEVTQNRPEATIVGGYAEHFLPRFVGVEFNSSAKRAGEIARALFSGSYGLLSASAYDHLDLSEPVLSAIWRWLESRDIATETLRSSGDVSVSKLKKIIGAEVDKINYFPMLNNLALGNRKDTNVEKANLNAAIATVTSILASEFPEERIVEPAFATNLREAGSLVGTLFRDAVKYLGPLRNPPRPVYQLEVVPSATDVGFRGEHTAAILDLNRGRRVSYISPPSGDLSDDYFSSATRKVATLHDAVVDWLSYLGVAEEVSTSDEGVFGNRLRVQTSGSETLHDLTNVGVGVSQVLPIVVMALLAPTSAFIILEQPELHLHPKVQARLADFLIALAFDGKQTLSETHSEYLVDRLRLRVALATNSALRESINIMFSKKANGGTMLVPIELTEYGSILDWPEDFFDQSQSDVGRILKAAAAKRRRVER